MEHLPITKIEIVMFKNNYFHKNVFLYNAGNLLCCLIDLGIVLSSLYGSFRFEVPNVVIHINGNVNQLLVQILSYGLYE